MHFSKSARGYSFAELLVVMSMVAALATVAVPSVSKLRAGANLASAQRDVMTALYVARSSAIATNAARSVVITPPNLIVIQDQAKTTTYYTRDLNVYGTNISIAGNPVTITFDARGMVNQTGSLTLTINNGQNQSKTVSVYPTGKAAAN